MKRILTFIAAIFIVTMASAQNNFYVSLGVGAGINTARTYDLYQDGLKVHPVGLGKGFAPVLRAGIFLNDFMAVELGVAYRLGFSTKIDVSSSGSLKSSGMGTGTFRFSGGMLQLVPAVLIQPNLDLGSVAPYARVGVLIGIIPNIKQKMDLTGNPYYGDLVAVFKYTGGVSVGGSAALGCDFNLMDNLAIYVEIYYDAMSYAPTKGKYTKFTVNGQDKLSDLTTQQKEVTFVKDLTGYTPGSDQPTQELKNSYPFNNIGLNFGVKIKL